MNRQLSLLDRFITESDKVLRSLSTGTQTVLKASPATGIEEPQALTKIEKQHAAGLMRVNHSGEVCAQALYQGQSLTAKLPSVRKDMEDAAREEVDHLAWCDERLRQLNSHPSRLNPLFYGLSFGLGACAGLVSDRVSLGFVAATEELVCKHLDAHLQRLPEHDIKSRAIVQQMRADEARHQQSAIDAGGYRFPAPVRFGMTLLSKAMTKTSYYL